MLWFPTPQEAKTPPKAKIYASFKEKDKVDIEISEDIYHSLRALEDWKNAIIVDSGGRILFEGKRREIREFVHVYPKQKKDDEYMLSSYLFWIEKEKRDAKWAEYYPTISQDKKDEVWSVIYSRWGKTYSTSAYSAWYKAYFKGMFKVLSLELAWWKDWISSKDWIIPTWIPHLEIPEMYGNVEMYRSQKSKQTLE